VPIDTTTAPFRSGVQTKKVSRVQRAVLAQRASHNDNAGNATPAPSNGLFTYLIGEGGGKAPVTAKKITDTKGLDTSMVTEDSFVSAAVAESDDGKENGEEDVEARGTSGKRGFFFTFLMSAHTPKYYPPIAPPPPTRTGPSQTAAPQLAEADRPTPSRYSSTYQAAQPTSNNRSTTITSRDYTFSKPPLNATNIAGGTTMGPLLPPPSTANSPSWIGMVSQYMSQMANFVSNGGNHTTTPPLVKKKSTKVEADVQVDDSFDSNTSPLNLSLTEAAELLTEFGCNYSPQTVLEDTRFILSYREKVGQRDVAITAKLLSIEQKLILQTMGGVGSRVFFFSLASYRAACRFVSQQKYLAQQISQG
ncbi:hypothetical protein HDU76_009716, partial [Blyttiomyces sp. JEL0837]